MLFRRSLNISLFLAIEVANYFYMIGYIIISFFVIIMKNLKYYVIIFYWKKELIFYMKKCICLLLCITVLIGLTACGNRKENIYNDYSDKIDEGTKYVKVPIAKEDIARNQVINSDMIEIVDFDESKLIEDIILNINQLIGKKVIINISKGSYFSNKDIDN